MALLLGLFELQLSLSYLVQVALQLVIELLEDVLLVLEYLVDRVEHFYVVARQRRVVGEGRPVFLWQVGRSLLLTLLQLLPLLLLLLHLLLVDPTLLALLLVKRRSPFLVYVLALGTILLLGVYFELLLVGLLLVVGRLFCRWFWGERRQRVLF